MREETPTIEQARHAYCDGLSGTSRTRAESIAEFDRMIAEVEHAAAAKALDEFENELVTREMPEAGAHINMTPYREGKIDGVNRAAIAAARRAEAYRREETE